MNKVIEASATTTAFHGTPKIQASGTNSKRKSNNIVMASSNNPFNSSKGMK